jgi:molybdate transport system ATP-binding protein
MEESDANGLQAHLVKQLAFFTINVSLQCAPGETVILTGPSGSGKTTILRCLAGLERLDNGFIRFNGTGWSETSTGLHRMPRHRKIGFLAQNYGLFPHMTVYQNVRFALRPPEDADYYLTSMGIWHLRHKKPHEISGGELQRAALCQTLASKPQLLLLDEPFSALDIENRYRLREWLATVQSETGLAIIHVTHDLAEALISHAHLIAVDNGQESSEWLARQQTLLLRNLHKWHGDVRPASPSTH